jgi:hypothetical protein
MCVCLGPLNLACVYLFVCLRVTGSLKLVHVCVSVCLCLYVCVLVGGFICGSVIEMHGSMYESVCVCVCWWVVAHA